MKVVGNALTCPTLQKKFLFQSFLWLPTKNLIFCTCLKEPITQKKVSTKISYMYLKKHLLNKIPFFSFSGITHAYLLKISITYNQSRNIYLLIAYPQDQ